MTGTVTTTNESAVAGRAAKTSPLDAGWQINGQIHRGPPAAVLAAIAANPKLDAADKAWITFRIQKQAAAGFNFITVHGHLHAYPADDRISLHIIGERTLS